MALIRMPLVAAQGIWLRATVTPAPPASGPTEGIARASAPDALDRAPLRVAVLGDSTAAGCGTDSHDNGFAGHLARAVAARAAQPVQWRVVGQYGATSRRVRYRLLPQLREGTASGDDGAKLDAVVLLAGANDVLTRRTPDQWREDATAVLDDLADHAHHVIVSGIPPFALFPSMPKTLGRYLAERADALDAVTRDICASRPHASWVTMPGRPPAGFFAVDRFHPSAEGYRVWAEFIADRIPLSPRSCRVSAG